MTTAANGDGSCLDADGMSAGHVRFYFWYNRKIRFDCRNSSKTHHHSVIHNDATAGQSTLDLGQRGHGLNESGYGSWPYIRFCRS